MEIVIQSVMVLGFNSLELNLKQILEEKEERKVKQRQERERRERKKG